ncbi:MAG: 2-dehydropantoate 2-reductase [Halioglobus sp.]|nr:2-dehydropantoate 2-reductase [Halioglobus sp.]
MNGATGERIVIAGAGAIGCHVGLQLDRAGAAVTLLGSERVAADVAAHGLRVDSTGKNSPPLTPEDMPFTVDPACCADAALVVVTVKSLATGELAAAIAPHVPRGCAILTLQNGVSNGPRLAQFFPDNAVLQGVIMANVVEAGPGHFRLTRGGGISLEQSPAPALKLFDRAPGLGTRRVTDIRGALWSKLLLNLTNPLNAISGAPLRENLQDRDFRLLLCACMREGVAVVRTAGIALERLTPLPTAWLPHVMGLPNALFLRLGRDMLALDPAARTSMAQDIERGRPTEIDYLNGEIVRLAERCGARAPLNRMVTDSVKTLEREGSGRGADLMRELLRAIGR